MQPRRSLSPQEVPRDAAEQLRALLGVDNVLLNALLAAYRGRGWRTPTLAAALALNPPAVSKRIERARARGDDPGLVAAVARFSIPDPPRIQAMINGQQLDGTAIAKLKQMQLTASRINGAVPAGHPDRRVGEQFSAELNRLVTEEGFTPYYLARVLGVSHRAITSRLERHHFRDPCPSVAGTASGLYFGRKIGDPGQGAPRLTREERAELRALWETGRDDGPARGKLTAALRGYLREGFTLANLSQTMSTRETKIHSGQLAAVLGRTRETAEAGT
jgi:hypothetical protein